MSATDAADRHWRRGPADATLEPMTSAVTTVTSRAYRDEADWVALLALLRRAYAATGRWRCWTPDRIDGYLRGCRYDEITAGATGWEERVRLWHGPDGELVAAVHPEGTEETWLELDPAWEWLAPEMLEWAEAAQLRRHAGASPVPYLQAYATSDDAERQALLAGRGYLDRGPTEVLHGRSLVAPGPAEPLAAGYTIRPIDLDDAADRDQLVEITHLAFPHATYDERAIDLEGIMRTEHEYLAAVTDEGRFASFCGAWSSPEIGIGQFEPVGTHPDHRRRGLAAAVMARGLAWMRDRGLRSAFVGTGTLNPSNFLYASLGFRVAELYHQWEWSPRRLAEGRG